jgi:hypothetical protein
MPGRPDGGQMYRITDMSNGYLLKCKIYIGKKGKRN